MFYLSSKKKYFFSEKQIESVLKKMAVPAHFYNEHLKCLIFISLPKISVITNHTFCYIFQEKNLKMLQMLWDLRVPV